jgi:hypothetical protein
VDNTYELESRAASASRPALAPPASPAAVVASAPPTPSAPAKDPPAMARAEGLDFTPIVTHYVFLVTFVLAIVSKYSPLRSCAATTELTYFSQLNR